MTFPVIFEIANWKVQIENFFLWEMKRGEIMKEKSIIFSRNSSKN